MSVAISTMKEKYYILLYFTIFSIFLTDYKLYIPLFALNILYVGMLILKREIKLNFSKWQLFLLALMVCSIIGTGISLIIFKHDLNFANIVKLNLNCLFFIAVGMIFEQDYIILDKSKLIIFLEFIIIANFIQIILIYVFGGLFSGFLSGDFAKNSDSAYIISLYKNFLGGDNKNIWASKFVLVYVAYLYALISFKLRSIPKYIYSVLGGIVVLLILSRTAQLAVAVPILFYAIYTINTFEEKYSKMMFLLLGVVIGLGGVIFFEKFFHIQFNMSDGGFTRLLIWKEFLVNVWDTHWIVGNGIGYGATFISEVVGRSESNLHNVFFNIFFELGAIGLVAYVGFLFTFLKEYLNKKNIITATFIIFVPLLFIMMMQYFGYDNDIIVLFVLFLIVTKMMQKDVKNEK